MEKKCKRMISSSLQVKQLLNSQMVSKNIFFLEDRTKFPPHCATKTPTVPHFRLMFVALINILPFKKYMQPPNHKEFYLKQQMG